MKGLRKLRQWVLLLGTLLLTVGGAALPYTVSRLQDVRVEKASETRAFDPVSLTMLEGGDVLEVLRLLSGSVGEMDWIGKTNLTEQDVGAAVEEALRRMSKSGLLALPVPAESEYSPFHMYVEPPRLIMSLDESGFSAVVWMCWIEELEGNMFCIDDKTGKMVRCFLYDLALAEADWDHEEMSIGAAGASAGEKANMSSNSKMVSGNAYIDTDIDTESVIRQAERWRSFLSAYYGVELSFSESRPYLYDSGYSTYITFTYDAGQEKTGSVGLEIQDSSVYFNA